MLFPFDDLIKLGMAVLLGGLIGAEREFRDKAAGFRTMIFITVGATLFTIFSLRIGSEINPTRIAANIVSGIGFLGAGAILREEGKVAGLTTAATIWLAAALGMGIGAGEYGTSILATAVILLILWFFPTIERWIDQIHHTATYELTFAGNEAKVIQISEQFEKCNLTVTLHKRQRRNGTYTCTWKAIGKPKDHQKLLTILLTDTDLYEVKY
ncbi:MAG: MgtC/SapB family protein [Anaerolineae bacterium]